MASLTTCNVLNNGSGNFGPAVRFAAQVSIDAGSVTGSTHAAPTGSVPGLKAGMVLVIGAPVSTTAAVCVGGGCDANDVLRLDYVNPGASATPTSGTYTIIAL